MNRSKFNENGIQKLERRIKSQAENEASISQNHKKNRYYMETASSKTSIVTFFL